MPEPVVVRGACPHDCPDTCAWDVTVEDGRAVKLVGVADPLHHGGLCAKVNHYLDRVYGPQRLLHPLRRTSVERLGRVQQVTWDEALDDIAASRRVVDVHGGEAVLPYSYGHCKGLLQGAHGPPVLPPAG
jgi:anaerobic selenocysteine-containing dehydrogenase